VCQEWEDKAVVDLSGKEVKRKQATLKTRQSIDGSGPGKCIDGSDSDSDDDFTSTKKAATAAEARSKPVTPTGGASHTRPKVRKESDNNEDGMSFDDE
jgi:DNA topoisomerase-2